MYACLNTRVAKSIEDKRISNIKPDAVAVRNKFDGSILSQGILFDVTKFINNVEI